MSTIKDLVLARLRKEKIRLWLPPYHQRGDIDDVDDADEALTKLAVSLEEKLTPRQNDNSNDGGGGAAIATTEEIRIVLAELRSHAVRKLIDKNSVDVRILTSSARSVSEGVDAADVVPSCANAADAAEAALSGRTSSWGDEVSILRTNDDATRAVRRRDGGTGDGGIGDNRHLRLRVINLSPALTVGEFSSDICRALNAKTVRVIWKGKNLLSSSGGGGDGGKDGETETLQKLLAAGTISSDKKGGGAVSSGLNQKKKKKKGELLCLVSGIGCERPAVAAPGTAPATEIAIAEAPPRTDSAIIESIRAAARRIQNSPGKSRFEVTDQGGNLVPMRQRDVVAFLSALGLHRIGRSKMERRKPNGATGETRDAAAIMSALVFLLEADAEWNASPALCGWKSRVDNYGLLQLDVAWCYLLLGSLDDLDDALRRLDVAERALRKQVHANFVTLALAQAEMENPIPPLCAVFARLFLLQGVANKIASTRRGGDRDDDAARAAARAAEEGLAQAALLCRRLRSSAPPESTDALCRAYVVDPPTAIAALRRTNGDPDAAGELIASDRREEGRAAAKRRRQRRMGRCANGTDFVDLDLVPPLCGMLGFGDGVGGRGIPRVVLDGGGDEGDGAVVEDDLSTGASIAIGLLRLSDNGIEKSLELYNGIGADQIMERISRLDEDQGRRKRRSKRRDEPAEHEVRDMDLTMLVSMGVGEERSREALKATGNVESALLWLSKDDSNNRDDAKSASIIGGDDAASVKDCNSEGRANNPTTPDRSNINDGKIDNSDSNKNETVVEDREDEGDADNSSAPNHRLESDDDSSDGSDSDESEMDDAHELLERELGQALGADSKQLLEVEWLGADMQDEWDLIQRYT